jgi:hypothetical protein
VRDLTSSPDLLAAQAARVFGPAERWPRVARTYIEGHSWAADGGLTEAAVERTLAFFADDTLRHASPRDVSDLSFLREALSSLPAVERTE